MSSALEGIKIADFSSYIAGPYASSLLCDMGADVIKVERPAGDPCRGRPDFLVWNRGKRSIVLDLYRPEAKEVVRRLVETADVLIESFRPSTVTRLGLSYEDLAKYNPRLVYCSISGFGSTGPYRDLPGYDPLVAAIAGIPSDQGGDEKPPVYVNLPVASYGTALLAAYGIAAALYDRELRGRGQWLEVPLVNGALAMQTGSLLAREGVTRINAGDPQGGVAVYRLYQCADDWIFIACGNQTFWQKLCLALDLTDLLSDPRFENAPWNLLPEDQRELIAIITPIIRQKTRAEWLAYLAQCDVPCAPVGRNEDFMSDPQVLANEMSVDVFDPTVGPTKQIGIPVRLLSNPGQIKGPAPLLGQHTAEILRELGFDSGRIAALEQAAVVRQGDQGPAPKGRVSAAAIPTLAPSTPASPSPRPFSERKHALEGVKVVDFGSYIAGSYASTLLAGLGAEVVKVESLQGDPFRAMLGGFQGWNLGKQSLAVDLRQEKGKEIVYRMVESADVVVENFRRGVAEKIGMGYETLRHINPRIIYCAMAGHGETGPRRDDPGFDPLFQARGGAMAAQGGRGHPPVYLRIAISDYAAAMLAAFGVSLALGVREKTGLGQRIELALTNATMAIQAGRFILYEGKPAEDTGGPDLRGLHATCRLYEAIGGWLFLLCPDEAAWRGLCRALGRPNLASDKRFASPASRKTHDAVLVEVLSDLFHQKTQEECLTALAAEGVPCAPVLTNPDVMSDPHLLQNELVVALDHPSLGTFRQVGITVKLRETPGRLWGPAPDLGQHTDVVLAAHGYSPDDIARLRQAKVIL